MTASSTSAVHIHDEDPQVSAQLRDVESRLVDLYAAEDGEERVRQAMATNRARFADARVRTFVPILVERAVRAEMDG
jgi:hypothetical protein